RRTQRGRRTDLPEHPGGARASAQDHLATGAGGQGRGHLKDEDRVAVALGIEGEVTRRDLQRGGGAIKAGRQGLSAEVSGDGDWAQRAARGVVVGDGEVRLSLRRGGIAGVLSSGEGRRPKA